MADNKPLGTETSPASATANVKVEKPSRPPNPVWRMMGLPRIRLRLPSRNWMIFLSITGSFSAAVIYDKRERRKAQRKWCKLVEHLAKEPLGVKAMPRRLTIFLEGPPGDGLRVAQDHFKEYVKPVLVSSGLDWEFVQGRKEGDVRAELAEKIRAFRTPESEVEEEDVTTRIRKQNSIVEFDGPRGDIVVGRHAWKEYIRGLHEGWLGPIKQPALLEERPMEVTEPAKQGNIETLPGITIHSVPVDSDNPVETPTTETAAQTPPETPTKPLQPDPFISTAEYQSAPTPAGLPQDFDPSIPIQFPHILGFFNTPLRLYRFLNRRQLADSIGRDTAAIVLSLSRPYHTASTEPGSSFSPTSRGTSAVENNSSLVAEQATVLKIEEKDWHKSTWKRVDSDRERTWLDEVVLDPRIADRMRKAELTPEDDERAKNIIVPEEEIEGNIKGGIRRMFQASKRYLTAPKTPKGPELGNIDAE